MNNEINNSQDVIDSRDVIARIEELRGELEEVKDETSEQAGEMDLDAWLQTIDASRHPFSDSIEELQALEELAKEAGDYAADWEYGEMLIRDSYFADYARELAEDIGAVKSDAAWPARCIDWEQAARELQMDYTSVEFDGVTYWIR